MVYPSESAAPQAPASAFKITPRRSGDRGSADHDWLKTYHTFSFAGYQSSQYDQFGPLRVINEDRVLPSTGFGMHSHANFEIWSYIVDGELEHKDSLGNTEIMKRGDLQMTSTGTGISHSEYNRNSKLPVHFLQIWGLPSKRGLKPSYYGRHFSDDEKRDKLVKVVAPVGSTGTTDKRNTSGPAPVHAPITMFASILSSTTTVSQDVASSTTKVYVHLIMRSGYRRPTVPASDKFEDGGARVRINGGLVLEEGDGAFVQVKKGEEARTLQFENVGKKDAEFILFELED